MNILKKYWRIIILAVILISLDIYFKQWFYTILFAYGLMIKLFLSEFLSVKFRKIFAVAIWSAFLVVMSLTFYVNHYLPHGPSYSTGEIVCQNDDRGPCSEEYKEDMRVLDIPDWAKFLREYSVGVATALAIAGICLGKQAQEDRVNL